MGRTVETVDVACSSTGEGASDTGYSSLAARCTAGTWLHDTTVWVVWAQVDRHARFGPYACMCGYVPVSIADTLIVELRFGPIVAATEGGPAAESHVRVAYRGRAPIRYPNVCPGNWSTFRPASLGLKGAPLLASLASHCQLWS